MLMNSYWDLNDILMSQDPIECKLERNLDYMSENLLNLDNNSEYLKDDVVKLPISLAYNLLKSEAISLEVPSYFSDEYYHLLEADATVPSLIKEKKYYYEKFELLKPEIFPKEEQFNKWAKCLSNSIAKRFFNFFIVSKNVNEIDTKVEQKMSFIEERFFNQMTNIFRNIKYFKENYANNNKVLEAKIEAKKNRHKIKKDYTDSKGKLENNMNDSTI